MQIHLLRILISGLAVCAGLNASALPAGDSLTISLDPPTGALHGLLGATVGWGVTVTWSSTDGHWISFTGSSLGSVAPGGFESNPAVLAAYTDNIGAQGGPVDFALGPAFGPWTIPYDGVSNFGLGYYQITTDIAQLGANDHGQITINFDVTDRNPYPGGVWDPGTVDLTPSGGSYYEPATAFSVTVDVPGAAVPEPSTWLLSLAGVGAFAAWRARGRVEG